jgi:hypothetical protein
MLSKNWKKSLASSFRKEGVKKIMLNTMIWAEVAIQPLANQASLLCLYKKQINYNISLILLAGKQPISLSKYCRNDRASIQHETMHKLGISHEHQRPDRDQYIDVIRENIESNGESTFPYLIHLNNLYY